MEAIVEKGRAKDTAKTTMLAYTPHHRTRASAAQINLLKIEILSMHTSMSEYAHTLRDWTIEILPQCK
jgi:hypothetical protein